MKGLNNFARLSATQEWNIHARGKNQVETDNHVYVK